MAKAQAAAAAAAKKLAAATDTVNASLLALKEVTLLQKAVAQFEKSWKKEAKSAAVAKKRGRKAKTVAVTAASTNATGKKRGRKPKSQVVATEIVETAPVVEVA